MSTKELCVVIGHIWFLEFPALTLSCVTHGKWDPRPDIL